MSIQNYRNFVYPDARSIKNQDNMDTCNQNSGSTRFRSAPSSYQESEDDYQLIQSPSQELEDLLARYASSCYGENCMKEEDEEFVVSEPNGYFNGSDKMYDDLSVKKWSNGGTENRMQAETGSLDGSNLGFRASHMNLSSEPSSSNSKINPRISGIETQNDPNFCNESWKKSSFGVLNGSGGHNINFSGLNSLETHSEKSKNRLTHHQSLPASFSNKSSTGSLLQFQETIQFKTRAKRGFATHPRSIAERVRRTRISERIKKLQDLVPNMDKQTSTAEMLDMAVGHIKELQKQVKALTGTRARCTCGSEEKQIGSCS